jgi:NAD dependent epimerase/dehydratase family enzyme
MSWIGLTELTAVIAFLLARDDLAGPVNATAPNPVSNREFTAALAAAVHRPAVLAVPVPVLRLVVGGASADLLSSARVLPRRLLGAGYAYQHPDLAGALAAELGR